MSTSMTCFAPKISAHLAAIIPIGPAPKINTLSPAVTSARLTACWATVAGSTMASASLVTSLFSEKIRCHFDGMIQYCANPPSHLEPR